MDSSPAVPSSSSSSPSKLPSPLPPFNEDGTHPCLPWPGLRYHPAGDVVIRHFVSNKVLGAPLPINPIKEIDVYLFEPDELPVTISDGNERWMYFMYMTEENSDRSTPKGYWKLDVSDEPIKDPDTKEIIGLKNTFIYYSKELGPNGRYKTNWNMQEFRAINLENLKDPKMKNWVVCKIQTVIPREYEAKVSKRGKRKKSFT